MPSNKMLKGVLEWTAKYKDEFMQGPLLLDGLLGAERSSLLKIKIFLKSSFGVNVKVHISHQKMFCKDMFIQGPWFIHLRFIVSQSL